MDCTSAREQWLPVQIPTKTGLPAEELIRKELGFNWGCESQWRGSAFRGTRTQVDSGSSWQARQFVTILIPQTDAAVDTLHVQSRVPLTIKNNLIALVSRYVLTRTADKPPQRARERTQVHDGRVVASTEGATTLLL